MSTVEERLSALESEVQAVKHRLARMEALHGRGAKLWQPVDAIYHRLAASGRTFSDSAELLREDGDR